MNAGGWYHCRVKTVSRTAGRSVVAAAAYRLGERLHEEGTDQFHDFTRRSGIESSFSVAPDQAPDWARDPEALWNAADARETRSNSRLARECELALPAEVGEQERERIAWGFAQELADRYGVASSVAIHEPGRGDDRNYHAHILFTTRRIDENGLGEKTRELDDRKTGPEEILYLRQRAADLINESLERCGLEERVDHRSFETRGIELEPTEHLGPTAAAMERRGRKSERGERNRDIAGRNSHFDGLVQELAELDAEIAAEQERRLNERFGGIDLEQPPFQELEHQDSDIAGGRARRAGPPESMDVEAVVRPAVQAVEQTGDTSESAGWWGDFKTTFEHYREAAGEHYRNARDRVRSYVDEWRHGDRDPPDQSR